MAVLTQDQHTMLRPTGRQSLPANYNPFVRGGLAPIPRRLDADPWFLADRGALESYAAASPLRLLEVLRLIHPTLAQETENVLSSLCKPGSIKLIAVTPGEGPGGNDAIDPDATQALETFSDSLPAEVGGWMGLYAQGVDQLAFTGMACLEAVPGPRNAGLTAAWPVDSLTVFLAYDGPDVGLAAYQRQTNTGLPYKRMPGNLFFRSTLHQTPDNPYGIARFASALGVCLRDLARTKDLEDAIHHTAWPRMVAKTNLQEAYKRARAVPEDGGMGLSEEDAWDYATKAVQEERNQFADIKSDDTIACDETSSVEMLSAGNFQGLQGVLEYLSTDKVQAVKGRKVYLGYNDSSTETQAELQVEIQTDGLEYLRDRALAPVIAAANLHLRLLGLPFVARAVCEPIRAKDRLAAAQSEQVELDNGLKKVQRGLWTKDDYAESVTGSGLTGEEMPGAYDVAQSAGALPPESQGRLTAVEASRQRREQAKQGKKTTTTEADQ